MDGEVGGLFISMCQIGDGLGLNKSREELSLLGGCKRRVLLWGRRGHSDLVEEMACGINHSCWDDSDSRVNSLCMGVEARR